MKRKLKPGAYGHRIADSEKYRKTVADGQIRNK